MNMKPKENLSTTSGDELVARASFGTQIGVSLLVGVVALFTDPKPLYFLALLSSIVGSLIGYHLWTSGQKRWAAILGTGGLLLAGIVSHLFLGTVGGPTGILFLAAVITAGGLGGRLEATVTSIIALLAITFGYLLYPDVLVMNEYLLSAGFIEEETAASFVENVKTGVPEFILLAFLGFSIPCWGAYVVALDTSNRRARAKAEAALEDRAILADRIQQAQRLESVMRVSGEVAHDFNNTLMVIAGNIDVLENNEEFPEAFSRHLNMMKNATRISSGLTNKLLTFCQGKSTPAIRLSPMKVIQELVPLLEFTLRSKGRLKLDIASSNRKMEISEGKLEQIILNLITNARDAINDDGEIALTVQHAILTNDNILPTNEQDGTHIWIKVRDDGIGMSPELQKMATEPFYSSKPSAHLGGLGLSIVKGIVAQSNGVMKIDSTVGKGTTFHIALPLYRDTPTQTLPAVQGQGQAILLIDDEPDVRFAVAKQLEMLGYSVTQASNSKEAIQSLRNREYLLVITDIRLKGESGIDLVRMLREQKHLLPVLYMTGFADASDDHYQGNEVLIKPFTGLQLQRKISRVLSL